MTVCPHCQIEQRHPRALRRGDPRVDLGPRRKASERGKPFPLQQTRKMKSVGKAELVSDHPRVADGAFPQEHRVDDGTCQETGPWQRRRKLGLELNKHFARTQGRYTISMRPNRGCSKRSLRWAGG